MTAFNKILSTLVILTLLMASCSTGKENITVNSLGDVLTNLAPKPQTFEIDPTEETILTGDQGTAVYIPADAFQFPDGTTPTAKINIELKECYSLSSMVAENMNTMSGPRILETVGMIYFNATADGRTLSIKDGKAFVIGFPKENKIDEMDLFYDVALGDTMSTWVPDYQMYQVEGVKPGVDSIQSDGMEGYTVYPINMTDDLFDYDLSLAGDEYVLNSPLKGQNRTIFEYISDQTILADSINRDLTIQFTFSLDKKGKIRNFRVDDYKYSSYNAYARRVIRGYFENAPAFDLSADTIQVKRDWDYTVRVFGHRKVNEERFKKKFREQYSQYTNRAIQKMDKNVLDYYMFSATKMGWINCDRFWDIDDEKKTHYVVKTTSPKDTKVQIIFKDIKSIMVGAYEDEQVVFRNVPLGRKIKIIGISYANGKPTIGVKEATIDKIGADLTLFKEFSLDELEIELNKMN